MYYLRDDIEDSDTEIKEVIKKRRSEFQLFFLLFYRLSLYLLVYYFSVVIEDSDSEKEQDIKDKAVEHPKKKLKKSMCPI